MAASVSGEALAIWEASEGADIRLETVLLLLETLVQEESIPYFPEEKRVSHIFIQS